MGSDGYDVKAVRACFPALSGGRRALRRPGRLAGARRPSPTPSPPPSRRRSPTAGRVTAAERAADDVVLAARAAMADLLGADPGGVVFGRSMTALTFDMARTLAAAWRPGDEVVVTRLDHDANIRPWVLAAQAVGATVRWVEFDPRDRRARPPPTSRSACRRRTRLVAVTGASNLIGTRPPSPRSRRPPTSAARWSTSTACTSPRTRPSTSRRSARTSTPARPTSSSGPHCGVLAAAPALLETLPPDKLLPSTDAVPERFELGTLPYELLAGTTAAVDFLAGLDQEATGTRRDRLAASLAAVERHEDRLRHRIEDGLAALRDGRAGVVVHSRAARRTPTLLLSFPGRGPDACQDAYRFLAERGVNAPAGTFYALEASRRLGFGDAGALRVGLAPYTDDDDVDRLLDGLGAFLARPSG